MDFRHTSIVVAFDGSEPSQRALRRGVKLAIDLELGLKIVHVFPREADASAGFGSALENAEDSPAAQLAGQAASLAEDMAGAQALDIEPVVLDGDPAHALLDYLDECDRPIMVMGRRGHGALSALLLGSVSDKVVRHAHCPVMIV